MDATHFCPFYLRILLLNYRFHSLINGEAILNFKVRESHRSVLPIFRTIRYGISWWWLGNKRNSLILQTLSRCTGLLTRQIYYFSRCYCNFNQLHVRSILFMVELQGSPGRH